jgi:hypothetical protein
MLSRDPPARVPQIAPRTPRQQQARMTDRPGRDPQRPYINEHASLGSLAKHMRTGLDLSQPTTVVNTHELATLLEHVITVGFGPQAVAQLALEREAALQAGVAVAREGMMGRLKGTEEDAGG